MTSLWRNFSGNVANSKWSRLLIILLLKFIEECNRLLPDGAADSTRCMGLCTHLNNASRRTVRKWLKRNNGHLITLQILIPWRDSVWSNARSYFETLGTKTVSELKDVLEKICNNFPQVLTKLSQVLEIIWQEYGMWRVAEDTLSIILHSKKCSHGVCNI